VSPGKVTATYSSQEGAAKFRRIRMSLRREIRSHACLYSILLMLVLAVVASPLAAQVQTTPKWDIFGGYQWTHPGGHVPDPNNPNATEGIVAPDLGQGAGAALRSEERRVGKECRSRW